VWRIGPGDYFTDANAPALPRSQRSRPADRLVGPIPRARADAASERLDAIFADRSAGYRSRLLRRGGEPQ